MARSNTSAFSLALRAILVGAGALCLAPLDALGRVGVTSASDGEPLGKPPNANERILRIGIDVQADELVTTGAKDRAHLVFLDGSSLTVGPNARIVIDRFVFDPATNQGDLVINASRGVLRLVGGRISKSKPIVIVTPASTIGIRGGITIVTVTQSQTVANFVFGSSMTVTSGGQTQMATRAGSQVVTSLGGVPGAPALLKPGSLGAAFNQLEGAIANDNKGADQSAQKSGFSGQNSGQPANLGASGGPNTTSNTLVNAISNAAIETQQATRQAASANAAPVVVIAPTNPAAPPGPTGGPKGPEAPPVPPSGPTASRARSRSRPTRPTARPRALSWCTTCQARIAIQPPPPCSWAVREAWVPGTAHSSTTRPTSWSRSTTTGRACRHGNGAVSRNRQQTPRCWRAPMPAPCRWGSRCRARLALARANS